MLGLVSSALDAGARLNDWLGRISLKWHVLWWLECKSITRSITVINLLHNGCLGLILGFSLVSILCCLFCRIICYLSFITCGNEYSWLVCRIPNSWQEKEVKFVLSGARLYRHVKLSCRQKHIMWNVFLCKTLLLDMLIGWIFVVLRMTLRWVKAKQTSYFVDSRTVEKVWQQWKCHTESVWQPQSATIWT